MSVRAYVIKKIEYGDCRFNLYHSDNIMNWLDSVGITDTLGDGRGGIMCIPKGEIQEALKSHEIENEYNFDADDLETLKAMLADCGDEEFAEYGCF